MVITSPLMVLLIKFDGEVQGGDGQVRAHHEGIGCRVEIGTVVERDICHS